MTNGITFHPPCNPNARISQVFGERPDYYGQFLVRDWDGQLKPLRGHEGVDWALPIGSPIYASLAGRVSLVSEGGNYGKQIRITAGDFTLIYAHLSKFSVRAGDEVGRGQIIGESGNSGNSTGPHLHFSIKLAGASKAGLTTFPADYVDPQIYLSGVPMTVNVFVDAIPSLNVRSGPAVAYPSIGKLLYNSPVTLVEPENALPLIGVTGAWVKVVFETAIGYCSAQYLRKELAPVKRAIGFDFSHHQSTLVTEQTWRDTGAAFLISRASYGLIDREGLRADLSYTNHLTSARAAGMFTGAYHYLTRFNSGKDQAQFFVGTIDPSILEMGLWADVEDAGLTAETVRTFCEECDQLTGRKTGIYTRKNFWEPNIGHDLGWAADRELWLAQYPIVYSDMSVPSTVPDSWDTWTIWQYAVKRPSFYPANLDHNVYNGTNEELWEKYKIITPPPPPELTLEERVANLEQRVANLENRLNTV